MQASIHPLATTTPLLGHRDLLRTHKIIPGRCTHEIKTTTNMHPLHPRSGTTSTLFTTTLAISFLVVGVPHLLPCPVDRRQFADNADGLGPDGSTVRRQVRKKGSQVTGAAAAADPPLSADLNDTAAPTAATTTMLEDSGRPKRECPVPKPRGIMGQILGFPAERPAAPEVVIVQGVESTRKIRQAQKGAQQEGP